MYGITEQTTDLGGSTAFKPGLNPEVTFEGGALGQLTDDGDKEPLIIFTWSIGDSQHKEVIWRIDEERVAANADSNPYEARINIKNVDGKSVLIKKGEIITAKAAILEEYRNTNKRIKSILGSFITDKAALLYNAKSYEDYGQWVEKMTKPFIGSKVWLLVGYNAKDMLAAPKYSKFTELCVYDAASVLQDSTLVAPTSLRTVKDTPDAQDTTEAGIGAPMPGAPMAPNAPAAPAAPSAPTAQ